MNPVLKMMARYVFAIAVSVATAQGWISEATAGHISGLVEQVLGYFVAFSPALYAAAFVDNSPKQA